MKPTSHDWRECQAFFASDLFHAVQMAGLFADSKTFADAMVKTDFDTVVQAYEDARQSGEPIDLAAFVASHFDLPEETTPASSSTPRSVAEYIEQMWPVLTRTPDTPHTDSLIALKRPYIVPGGRFREIYYWDSYFTALGLIDAGRQDMAVNMLLNFVDILNEVGCVPNGNRAYYYSRSQPPVLALFYALVKDALSPDQRQYVVAGLKKEYQFWMKEADHREEISVPAARLRTVQMPCGAVLNRYFDTESTPRPESLKEDIETARQLGANSSEFFQHIRAACESGWDFSSRWLADPAHLASIRTTEIIPVDLNALLVSLEQTLASVSQGEERADYETAAQRRIAAINTYLFSANNSGYFDLHFPTLKQTEVVSAATCVPLFVGIASQAQAASVVNLVSSRLLQAGGLATTSLTTRQQWDAPNGWAPLQLFAAEGFRQYGHTAEATTIMQRFCQTIEATFARRGVLLEKYNVCEPERTAGGGEYEVQLGFGWTNGVYTRFQTRLQQQK